MKISEFKKLVEYQSMWDVYNKSIDPKKTFHLLIECETTRVLVASRQIETINTMYDFHSNCYTRYDVNLFQRAMPNEFNGRTPFYTKIKRLESSYYQSEDDLTYDELYHYCLNVEKACLLDIVNFRIGHYRLASFSNVLMQESVYNFKLQEAQEIIKTKTIDENDDFKWPFVRDYANLYDLDLHSAAKNILLQNKFYKTNLCKSETLRLRTKESLRKCNDIKKIKSIFVKFINEGGIYGHM